MSEPLFTQRHYEHLTSEFRTLAADGRLTTFCRDDTEMRAAVEFLCRVFKRDNPKFKPEMFRDGILKERA